MNGAMKYGDVALGVEAALPAFRPERRPRYGYASLVKTLARRTLNWLYATFKRRA